MDAKIMSKKEFVSALFVKLNVQRHENALGVIEIMKYLQEITFHDSTGSAKCADGNLVLKFIDMEESMKGRASEGGNAGIEQYARALFTRRCGEVLLGMDDGLITARMWGYDPFCGTVKCDPAL